MLDTWMGRLPVCGIVSDLKLGNVTEETSGKLMGISIMLCMLTGCLEATPLTDEEMDVAAEYAASLLLKYDKHYDTPLYYTEEREVRLTPTPTPTPPSEVAQNTPAPNTNMKKKVLMV